MLWCTADFKSRFTPALFGPFELNPGAFTPLVQFVWDGVNAGLKLWYGQSNRSLVHLKEVVSATIQTKLYVISLVKKGFPDLVTV